MRDRLAALILAVLSVSACAISPSMPPSAATTSPPLATSAATCAPGDVSLAVGDFGSAGGTTYTPITVTLVGQGPCLFPTNPPVAIVNAAGVIVARSTPSVVQQAVLDTSLRLLLGWSSWCGPAPASPLVLQVMLGAETTSVALPAGLAASCQGVPTVVYLTPAGG